MQVATYLTTVVGHTDGSPGTQASDRRKDLWVKPGLTQEALEAGICGPLQYH
ncbi:hypothetical protein DPMN_152242 [Dreissena polymorpha]|uniref:Uncharacterized protein n=1 Tax=Dreissena polymorpha TaxID=45954 RepID=A0A9D4FKY1_DREPO|nr:hypothetical protein DPMN_152242 [Dreissena polymorpha]